MEQTQISAKEKDMCHQVMRDGIKSYGTETVRMAKNVGILKHSFGMMMSTSDLDTETKRHTVEVFSQSLTEVCILACEAAGVLPDDVINMCNQVESVLIDEANVH